MKTPAVHLITLLCAAGASTLVGCSTERAPARESLAVTTAAVDDAAGAGGAEFAPVEMKSAREKMALANRAMGDKDFRRADQLAGEAEADAKLAQAKANSAKAKVAADALQDDVRVLREELARASK